MTSLRRLQVSANKCSRLANDITLGTSSSSQLSTAGGGVDFPTEMRNELVGADQLCGPLILGVLYTN